MKPTIRCVLALVLLLTSSVAQAAIVTVPTGLNPGDQYYLAFVTEGVRDATSPLIAVYDTFVNAEADQSTSQSVKDITWRALGSTDFISAFTHLALTQHPIYLLDGTTKVADGATDLWDGSLEAAISLTQNATSREDSNVWTGTLSSGIGDLVLGFPNPVVGHHLATNEEWVQFLSQQVDDSLPFYAFSVLQTVPASNAVPEPASLAVWGVFVGCAVAFWKKRRQRLSA